MSESTRYVYGPVPSRRLGQSLGVDPIPFKTCNYNCVYCQLGRACMMQTNRTCFHTSGEILKAVEKKLNDANRRAETVDYLAFVPDGEPTLDARLGKHIQLLRPLGIKIAVITNASLLWNPDVREDLAKADWVSVKVDAVQQDLWRRIDRPHKALQLDAILDGIARFAAGYDGELTTETMLVRTMNDSVEALGPISEFIAGLHPATAYLSIPTRPPAEPGVRPPHEEAIGRAYQIFREKTDHVEYLIGYEGNAFAFTGDAETDILSITSVHPMREDAVVEFLARAEADWSVIEKMVEQGALVVLSHEGYRFYVRRFDTSHR